jgi:lysophospholipase L1-like esterase
MRKGCRITAVLQVVALLGGCSLFQSKPFVPSTIAALGDSITMGIQDAGLFVDNQQKCYAYLVARQMGQARGFQQPLAGSAGDVSTGIGVPPYETPLWIEAGFVKTDYLPEGITQEQLMQLVVPKLQNLFYPNPYNNLGVNGARLDDLNHATGYAGSYSHENFFYDIVLRNLDPPLPNLGQGKNAVEQAALLDPEYIFLWIGNNDVLGYVLSGGEDESRITATTTFETELRDIIDYLQANTTDAKIVLANIPEYLPFGYALDDVFVAGSPKLFNPTTLQPIDFTGLGYIDLQIADDDGETVSHLLLTAAAAYIEQGMGIDPSDLDSLTADQKAPLAGVTIPSGTVPLTKDLVFTDQEEAKTLSTIGAFNLIIAQVAEEYDLPLVDVNGWMQPGGGAPLPSDGCLKFALVSQDNTIFSLDGIHPNNYGHALIANQFIATMKASFGLNIPSLNAASYSGQYSGKALVVPALKAIRRLDEMYAPVR